MKAARNTFIEGMDQDTSLIHYKDTKYYKAENLRLFSPDGESVGSLQNEKGNQLSFKIPDNEVVIGYTNLRDSLILFTTNAGNTYPAPGVTTTTTNGSIWVVRYNSDNVVIGIDGNGYLTSVNLAYTGILNFSTANLIRAVAYHMNENIGKVYWTDNYNKLRHINVYDSECDELTVDQLDIVGSIIYSAPMVIEILDGGGYKVGAVQYAYQLYNKYGAESSISPTSPLYNLSKEPINSGSSKYFIGSKIGDNSGKAVMVKIPFVDNRYDSIRLYSLFYSSQIDTPIIRMVTDKKILNVDSINIIDDGINFIGELSLQEFRAYDKLIFSCQDLEIKDKRMVVANINESRFDTDYDARAYRFNDSNEFNIDSYGPLSGTSENWVTILEDADCITDDSEYPDDYSYKYKVDGSTYGGEGLNVSYEFGIVPIALDSIAKEHNINASRGIQSWSTEFPDAENLFSDNLYYESYASPINSAQMVGYQRGETYRFGVVFYNEKGQRSPVKWIGDIRFPAAYEQGSIASTYDKTIFRSISTREPGITIIQGLQPGVKYLDNRYHGTFNSQYLMVRVAFGDYGNYVDVPFYAFGIRDLVFSTEFPTTKPIDGTTFVEFTKAVSGWVDSVFGEELVASTISSNNYFYSFQLVFTSKVVGKTLDPDLSGIRYAAGPESTMELLNDYSVTSVALDLNGVTYVDPTDHKTYANILYPKFTLKNIPKTADGDPCSYEIVRVLRTDRDRRILSQGLILPTVDLYGTDSIRPISSICGEIEANDSSVNNGHTDNLANITNINIISPDINFDNIEIRKGDQIVPVGVYNDLDSELKMNRSLLVKASTTYPIPTVYGEGSVASINESGIIKAYDSCEDDVEPTWIGGVKFTNIMRIGGDVNISGKNLCIGGTSLFATIDSHISVSTTYQDDYLVANIVRPIVKQYGGNDYYARQNCEYVSCGAFVSPASEVTSTVYVFGGDTYIAYYDYLRCIWRDSGNNNSLWEMVGTALRRVISPDAPYAGDYSEVLFIPLETTINLDYRYDRSYSKVMSNKAERPSFIQERAGDYSGIVGDKYNYFQDYDLYLENPVYSRSNIGLIFLPELPDTDFVKRKDAQIYISEEFNYDNKNDNLIKFLPYNNTILNTSYGKINALLNYRDYLYVFQDKAIGVQFINERTILNDTTGSELAIGSGDVVGRFQYITTSSGCQHINSIVPADSGIYYFDSMSKSIYAVSGQDFNLTKSRGLTKYFDQYIVSNIDDDQFRGFGIHGIYDEKNSRLLWTYLNEANDSSFHQFTLGYSEVVRSFESFYSYYPSIYIKTFDNKILTVETLSNNNYGVYMQDVGNYGEYYNSYYSSTLNFVVNEDPLLNKQFASIEFPFRSTKLEVKPGIGVEDLYSEELDTIDHIIFANNYQTTENLSVVQTTPSEGDIYTEQRFRKWRIALPRVESNGRRARIADTYLSVRMEYENNDNRKIIFEDVITYYTPCVL